ncbi:hypothetical protein HKD37_17G048188 [Glycine soja]
MFLGGLKAESKLMLDASTGRKTSLKPPREAIEITENMDVNANEFQSDRAMVPSKRLLKFNTQEGLLAQQKLPGRKIEKLLAKPIYRLRESSAERTTLAAEREEESGRRMSCTYWQRTELEEEVILIAWDEFVSDCEVLEVPSARFSARLALSPIPLTRANREGGAKRKDLEVAAILEEEPQSSEASSSFPIAEHSHLDPSEDYIMAEEPRRVTLEDYSSSNVPQFFTSIAQPEFQAQTVTYPPSLIQLIQNNLFHGLPNEDPYAHLATYIEICNTIRLARVPEDAIQLSLFSFSLSGEAKRLQDVPSMGELMNLDVVFLLKNTPLVKSITWEISLETILMQEDFLDSNMACNIINSRDNGGTTLEISSIEIKVSMSNQKSTESAIKNLEVQVGQLAKQLADRSSSSFTANTEKNPKEECKAVMTRSRMAIQRDDSEAGKKMEEHKQQLAPKPALEPVSDFVELEEINEETEDDKEEKTPIKVEEKERIRKEEKEKEKKSKNEKQKEKVVDDELKRGKSEANTKKKKDITSNESKEVPYPLVPSRKDKERHLARFLDIFKKLEITLPFRETLQ